MPAQLLTTSSDDLDTAAKALRNGEMVAFPTETVYGLGADAFNAAAVARVFEAKQRPRFDPLIVHVADADDIESVAKNISASARELMAAFWPGPLTLVLSKTERVPSLVTSGLETVAVRRPAHPIAQEILRRAGAPVAAPSANPFGRLSPTLAQHVVDGLGDAVEYIVDGGPTTWGVESTIVDATGAETMRILRHGAIAMEELASVIGLGHVVDATSLQQSSQHPKEPGQLPKHYAPRTRLIGIDDVQRMSDVPVNSALLAFSAVPGGSHFVAVERLSESGDLREAAANLFDALHRLDAAGADVIFVEWVPETGIGRAINDRLRRAAATFQ